MHTIALSLPAEVTQANAPAVLAQLQATLQSLMKEEDAVVEMDASALQQFDSSVLAVLMAVRRMTHKQKGKWQVRGSSDRLMRLADVYGVKRLLFTPEL